MSGHSASPDTRGWRRSQRLSMLGRTVATLVAVSACTVAGTAAPHDTTTFALPAPTPCPAPPTAPTATPKLTAVPSGAVVASIPTPYDAEVVTVGANAVWSAAHGSNDLYRIDPATNRALDFKYDVQSANGRVFAISEGPDGVWVVVGPLIEGEVERVDTASQTLSQVTRVPGALSVVDTEEGLWIGVRPSGGRKDVVSTIDPKSGRVLRTTTVGLGGRVSAYGLAMVEAAGSIWVATEDNQNVVRLNPGTGKVVATVRLPAAPLAVAGSGSAVYVSLTDGTVARVEPQSNCVTAEVYLGVDTVDTIRLAVSGNTLAVAFGQGALALIDATTLAVEKAYRLDNQFLNGGVALGFGSIWFTTRDNSSTLRIKG